MALTDVEIIQAFDTEVGVILAELATDGEKRQWFNEGVNKLASGIGRWKPKTQDITWAIADRSVTLNTDFVQLDKITTTAGYRPQRWRLFGETLVLDDSDGATQAGAARVYYWAEWPLLAAAGTSPLTYQEDYLIKDFMLSRFYNKLASNRLFYKRYSTMVGQNAVSVVDLQNEADRYFVNFIDGREETVRLPPAFFYES